ncbi:DUF3306 domain-containing protein [Thiothrix subterranea]|uniref:DUF3306 domain-containing protein n=1 Tax=Thiothrix subterranea TaxID=2735563 RepID=A0AA51QXZ1_9GAMM|nr:DUF3306 domain-containing protein [Thiothrix subterranea]MDQ5770714.1 DUF3306 domain-containing protein [Thiothrix subterranea]WML87728.1 DUF3306 domain-containing protein [Thiothrix subterranea]
MSDETFFTRWARLKRERPELAPVAEPNTAAEPAMPPDVEAISAPAAPAPELTDADMPSLASLGFDSDYSGFFSAKVSSELRKSALRKLFHQPEFNVIDELNDYREDFTYFEPLGNLITIDMKHQLERHARQHFDRLLEDHRMTPDTLSLAREQALATLQQYPTAVVGSIGYQSQGRLLIIGDASALPLAAQLPDTLKPQVLLTDDQAIASQFANVVIPLKGRNLSISGHLGAFAVDVGGIVITSDLILDLQTPPSVQRGILPPGYFAPKSDELADTLAQLPEMIGEFSKPRYFHYDPSICAHSSSGLHGCTRCIDACPAEAIISIGSKIEVNPNLCQGGGACAAACPSGAIRYQYPSPAQTVDQLRILLRTYHAAGGIAPKILFHRSAMPLELAQLPPTLLPFPVEELGSVSAELWLAALSFGATQVLLYDEAVTPAQSRDTLQQQLAIAQAQLQGLGYPADAIHVLPVGTPAQGISPAPVMPLLTPATQGGMNDKRQQWRVALDHLYRFAPAMPASIALPAGAPFGTLVINKDSCTLCMACATICPFKAIEGGGNKPQLRFHPNHCVQCGLCATGCPEQAISLQPLYITDPEQRRLAQVLHEEPPFCCVQCGKPFGSQSAIKTMLSRLASHPMFQNPRALRRLEMCEDCRVMDVVQDPAAMG